MEPSAQPREVWWKKAEFYLIWVRSFQDSNGDGIGDLKGITQRIPYLQGLGIDAVWISPFFPSSGIDCGYDVKDYRGIDPEMGTMQDFDDMVAEFHKHGIRVVLDMVFNHCSFEHEWFVKSAQGDPKYKDYFIWKDGAGELKRDPPSNWASAFSGSAWTWSLSRNQFYFHSFAPEQPDLNWESPEVQREVVDIIRFWQAKGVDGFRLDATCHLSKPPGIPNYVTEDKYVRGNMHFNGPRMHEYIRIICDAIHEKKDAVCFGEMASIPLNEIDLASDPARKEMDMVILFEHTGVDFSYHPVMCKFNYTGLRLKKLKKVIREWYSLIRKGWINLYLCNHDQPRVVSRWGDEGAHWAASAQMLGMLYHFLRGTPFVYQGEEIGMTNWRFKLEEAQDLEFVRFRKMLVDELHLMTDEKFMAICHKIARDTGRTPVQWAKGPGAGFTTGTPWLPLAGDQERINVEAQLADPHSVLAFYRRMIRVRKEHPLLIDGELALVLEDDERLLAYRRFLPGQSEAYVALFNISPADFSLEGAACFAKGKFEVVLCNVEGYHFTPEKVHMAPWIGLLVRVTDASELLTSPEAPQPAEAKPTAPEGVHDPAKAEGQSRQPGHEHKHHGHGDKKHEH